MIKVAEMEVRPAGLSVSPVQARFGLPECLEGHTLEQRHHQSHEGGSDGGVGRHAGASQVQLLGELLAHVHVHATLAQLQDVLPQPLHVDDVRVVAAPHGQRTCQHGMRMLAFSSLVRRDLKAGPYSTLRRASPERLENKGETPNIFLVSDSAELGYIDKSIQPTGYLPTSNLSSLPTQ